MARNLVTGPLRHRGLGPRGSPPEWTQAFSRVGQGDDRPKIAFGRFREEGGRLLMPVAIDVHHALCDGVHVGRFFERFQAQLDAI